MSNKSTLTPVDIDVNVDGVALSKDITVLSFAHTVGVNRIAEATLSLGFLNANGLSALKAIFPSSEGKGISEISVSLRGFETPFSRHKEDLKLFIGSAVGYGEVINIGDISITISLKGAFYIFQETAMFTPGHHIASPIAFQTNRATWSSEKDIFRKRLLKQGSLKANGYDVFTAFVKGYEEELNASDFHSGMTGGSKTSAFYATLQALKSQKFMTNDLDNFIKIGDVALTSGSSAANLEDFQYNLLTSRLSQYSNNPNAKFWDFLMSVMVGYGLNIISTGYNVVGVPKIPMEVPVSQNIIEVEELMSSSMSDSPYNAPTRVVVSGKQIASNNETAIPIFGEYPKSFTPVGQEKFTGVKMLFVNAPGLLANIELSKKLRHFYDDVAPFDYMRNMKQFAEYIDAGKKIMKDDITSFSGIVDMYAEYILMTESHKQRTGQITIAYNPAIIPGLPGLLNSPLGLPGTEFQVRAVQHVLDAQQGQSVSILSVDHVRKEGEYTGGASNPFYPGYSPSSAASQIAGLQK